MSAVVTSGCKHSITDRAPTPHECGVRCLRFHKLTLTPQTKPGTRVHVGRGRPGARVRTPQNPFGTSVKPNPECAGGLLEIVFGRTDAPLDKWNATRWCTEVSLTPYSGVLRGRICMTCQSRVGSGRPGVRVRPETPLNPKPQAPNLNLNPRTQTVNPKPQTLNLNLKPRTQDLTPAPSTPNLKPKSKPQNPKLQPAPLTQGPPSQNPAS